MVIRTVLKKGWAQKIFSLPFPVYLNSKESTVSPVDISLSSVTFS